YDVGDEIKIKIFDNSRFINEEEFGLRIAVLDNEQYNKFLRAVKDNQLIINQYSSNKISSNIWIDEKNVLFTSILYDKGWRVYDNGVLINKLKIANAFIGFELDKGNHNLEFVYSPPGIKIGSLITIISVSIFILVIKMTRQAKKN
ncbi:MAG: YfhO family protein, partial [Eubacterium sp.]|nr:YfhO family protein [Eubacterium sp.]